MGSTMRPATGTLCVLITRLTCRPPAALVCQPRAPTHQVVHNTDDTSSRQRSSSFLFSASYLSSGYLILGKGALGQSNDGMSTWEETTDEHTCRRRARSNCARD